MQHRIKCIITALFSSLILVANTFGSVQDASSTSPQHSSDPSRSQTVTEFALEVSLSGSGSITTPKEIDTPESDDCNSDEFNPTGLQSWANEHLFLDSLFEGRLVLVVITAPWCDNDNHEIITAASQAADWIDMFFSLDSDEHTLFSQLRIDSPSPLLKPVIGTLESTSVPDRLLKSLGSVSTYPSLKFILTNPVSFKFDDSLLNPDEAFETNEKVNSPYSGDDTVLWDYIGPRESARDLYDSVLMYWYRFVLSNALERYENTTEHSATASSRPPVFSFGSEEHLGRFIQSHGDKLLRPAHPVFVRATKSTLQSEVFAYFIGGKHNDVGGVLSANDYDNDESASNGCNYGNKCQDTVETTQEIDPYILLVQCRSALEDDDDRTTQTGSKVEFDELAEEMAHRRDVAFFVIRNCVKFYSSYDGGRQDRDFEVDGKIAVLRARRFVSFSVTNDPNSHDDVDGVHHSINKPTVIVHNVTTHWREAILKPPHQIFIPSLKSNESVEITETLYDDPTESIEYIKSNLAPFIVTQTTPVVLWFDRHQVSQLAFPWYRKIHVVLFVDIGLSYYQDWESSASHSPPADKSHSAQTIRQPPWPSKLKQSNESTQTLFDQRISVRLFYNAALRHHIKHPSVDVVFLIVPSSETRILTKFGIDIWTFLDEALFPSKLARQGRRNQLDDGIGYCSLTSSNHKRAVLPAMVLTDSSSRSRKQSNRYYLCAEDILKPSSISATHGGSIAEFLDKFFAGTIGKPFLRSETNTRLLQSTQMPLLHISNNINVTVSTGNSFESMVMDRKDAHSMLLMQTITCGHCKRFSVLWNEFSSLVKAMNWGNIIDVLKIDISKNDIPHDKVDVWDVPSVYYFPAGEKDDPIEMTYMSPSTNLKQDYDEGLSWVASGYDLAEWLIRQGKLDLNLLIELDEIANIKTGESEHKETRGTVLKSSGEKNATNSYL